MLRSTAGAEQQNSSYNTDPDNIYNTYNSRRNPRGLIREEAACAARSRKNLVSPEEMQAFSDQLGEGLIVTHRSFGEGTVSHVDPDKVSIVFEEGEKTFSIRVLCASKLLEF